MQACDKLKQETVRKISLQPFGEIAQVFAIHIFKLIGAIPVHIVSFASTANSCLA